MESQLYRIAVSNRSCIESQYRIVSVSNRSIESQCVSNRMPVTGVKLQAVQKLAEVRREMVTKAVFNKAALRDRFTTKQAKRIMVTVEGFNVEQLIELQAGLDKSSGYALKIDDDVFQLTKELLEVKLVESTFSVEMIVPSVIEPSFGVGRIMYTILEHAFRQRDGDEEQLRKFLTESYFRNVLFDFECVVE